MLRIKGLGGIGGRVSRRRLLGLAAAGLVGAMAGACASGGQRRATEARSPEVTDAMRAGRLAARPLPASGAGPARLHSLGLGVERDGRRYVPERGDTGRPLPLLLALHGSGGNGQQMILLLQALAEELGVILLAPDSRASTWDIIASGYGPDVAFIDSALRQTFERYPVDPHRVAVGGFSDGASYALSLGVTNGDLFSHLLAFSPGFSAPASRLGAPLIYVSHGTDDPVLPIDTCSRRIVPQLERDGYSVRYHEFAGGHAVPDEIAREALEWFAGHPG